LICPCQDAPVPTDRLRTVTEQVAGLLDRAETEPDHPTEPEWVLFAEALAAVRAGGADLLDTVTPHLWAYYRDLAEACGDDNLGMDPLADGDDIWEHVELTRPQRVSPGFGSPDEPSPCYVNFEGEVSWEPEHGLQVVFDHSGAVCRVGPYSGRLTNTGPFAGAVYGW
jgi:hypothetical protein